MTCRSAIRVFPVILLFVSCLGIHAQEDAKDIFTRAIDQMLTEKMELSVEMETTDDRGRIKKKAYDILMGNFGEVEKIRMIMQEPERARGVTVVISNFPEGPGLIEVFTPANGKIRKMEATPENMERVGSSMYLGSYTSKDIQDLHFSELEATEVDGQPCHRIEVREPETAEGSGAHFFIAVDNFCIKQILVHDEEGNETSVTRLENFQPIEGMEGILQPMIIKTKNLSEQTSTMMVVNEVIHKPEMSESDFSIDHLGN